MTEDGEATLRIHLIDGEVIVKNAKGRLLMKGTSKKGLWGDLWKVLGSRVDVNYRLQAP